MESNEIIAKHKMSDLTVKVITNQNNTTNDVVLVGDKFCKEGDIDYWSTSNFNLSEKMNIPKHYNNDNGTLYQVATERGWNSYLFDIVKRLERAEKKGEFKTDLEKSKVVIDLWLKESEKL